MDLNIIVNHLSKNTSINKYNSRFEHTNLINFIKKQNLINKIPVIQIAGTNGKGSTSHIIASVLSSQYKVGLFTSPHIFKLNERIKINDEMITDEYIQKFYIKNLELLNKYKINFFEFMCVCAMSYFEDRNVDYIILEAGLGGMLDTTSYFDSKYSIITNIDFDHQNILGNTLLDIAKQKFGIIKPNNDVFTAIKQENLLTELISVCQSNVATYYKEEQLISNVKVTDKFYFTYNNQDFACDLNSQYQYSNINLALNFLQHFQTKTSKKLDFSKLNDVQKNTNFWGRFSKISNGVVDIAHNVAGIQNFLENINDENPIIILGILKTKDYKEMIELCLKHTNNLYFSEMNYEQGLKTIDYRNLGYQQKVYKNINIAIKQFKDKEIYISGSNYLIADIKF